MDGGLPFSVSADMPTQELEAQITELAGQLNAANYRWLLLIAEFDRRLAWNDGALRSCAHWLNFKVGLNLGAARERVRVAHALPGVPKIAAAMSRGELSYSKVRALTRVATPATEDTLLMIALHGTAYHGSAPHYEWTMLQSENAAQGLRIDSDTASTRWRGERMDFSFGVALICNQELKARHQNVSAETSMRQHDGVFSNTVVADDSRSTTLLLRIGAAGSGSRFERLR